MAIYQLGDLTPSIDAEAYVSPEATIIGNVTMKARSSAWPGVVVRADNDTIEIGADTNLQEGSVLHVDPGCPIKLADRVTVGHQVMLHGCTVGEGSLIGMKAVVLNKAVIGRNSLVGAGALVTEGKTFPDRSLILGTPARVVRELSDEEVANLYTAAEHYAKRQAMYKTDLKKIG